MTPADLKAARHVLGLSQMELARALGYTGKHAYQTIGEYERGTWPIPARWQEAINSLLSAKVAECYNLIHHERRLSNVHPWENKAC